MCIELLNNRSNMVLGIVNQLRNGPLIGNQHHPRTANLDSAGTAAQNPLNLLTFGHREITGIQTHKKSLSMVKNIDLALRVCLNNTQLYTAQVLNMQNVNIIFWKRNYAYFGLFRANFWILTCL